MAQAAILSRLPVNLAENGAIGGDVSGGATARAAGATIGNGNSMSGGQYIRQLGTIVSIDAVGFSRLMGFDDEVAINAFERRRDIISKCCESHAGRMFGTAGDSLMAEFGTPPEAVLATMEFQSQIAVLNRDPAEKGVMAFRAGINTGQIVIREGIRYGDDINIAARLQEIAPPGGIVISEITWNHVRDVVSATVRDLGEQDFHNISLPVRAFLVGDSQEAKSAKRVYEDNGFGFFRIDGKGGPPAVAVLPLRNESQDPELGYLGEAIAEDVITGLSHTRWLPVIAMNSSFQFRDMSMSPDVVGKALRARYVVTGSISKMGDHLRLRLALDDASTNRRIWSRRFDRNMAAIIEMQDEIGHDIVSMLEKEVDRVEQARTFRVPWESLENWQLVRRGRWHMQRRTREDTEKALEFFEKAHERDPNSSTVLNELCWWYFWRSWVTFGGSPTYREDLNRVADYARRALFLDDQDARPHAHLGICEIMEGRPRSALDHLERALELNPSFSFARSGSGSAHLLLGNAREAIPRLRDADRLSPFDHYRFHNLGELACAYLVAGEFELADAAAATSLSLSPAYWYSRFLRVAALGQLDRFEEAREQIEQLRSRHPDFSIRRIEIIPFADRSYNGMLMDAWRRVIA